MRKLPGNQRRVMKRGGSYTVTIPAVHAAQLGIEAGTIVRWTVSGRQLILESVGFEAPKRREKR